MRNVNLEKIGRVAYSLSCDQATIRYDQDDVGVLCQGLLVEQRYTKPFDSAILLFKIDKVVAPAVVLHKFLHGFGSILLEFGGEHCKVKEFSVHDPDSYFKVHAEDIMVVENIIATASPDIETFAEASMAELDFKMPEPIKTVKPREVPSWDVYMLSLAQAASTRSKDPRTQHGCVLAGEDKSILSTGYNGPVPGVDDADLDWSPENKNQHVLHAECNAVARAGRSLVGSTAYVTGLPCLECAKLLMAARVSRIVYGPVRWSGFCPELLASVEKLCRMASVELVGLEWDGTVQIPPWVEST